MADEKCILHPERDCIGAAAAARLEGRIEALETWQAESKRFHDTFNEWQKTQIERDTRTDMKLQTIQTNVEKLVAWQESQQAKPEKRWDAVVDKLIVAIVGAVIGAVLASIGL